MSTTNTPQPSEEVDLGQLFKMIGNAFQRLFQFIGSIFNKLFLAFVWLVFFIKKHAVFINCSCSWFSARLYFRQNLTTNVQILKNSKTKLCNWGKLIWIY
jgi:hypothetical protein